ncbi:CPBP family intramembrane glutamic endopeptidase [Corynebacterium sp. Q4381]|uniref:CPBP family intramembrane glutamic endopeptidase n=1 Tax=Corynebacterium sp. Marseille-Q4381 TaxID=3121597 RepID=UPI002FE5DEFC
MPFHRLAAARPGRFAVVELVAVAVIALGLQVVFFQTLESFPLADALLISTTLPAPFLAAWLTKRNPAELLSVERRIRWGVAGRALAASCAVYGAAALAAAASGRMIAFGDPARALRFTAYALVVVTAQSAAEELIFRGALPQIVGTWARSPWVAYGVPAALFLPLHATDGWGYVDIAVFTACAGWLTWFTGGVEAAIALHAAGNLLVQFAPVSPAASIALTVAATALSGWFARARA